MVDKTALTILGILGCVVLVATGLTDLDAQMMSYRFDKYHNGMDFWELTPFLKIGWWDSYAISVLRMCLGFLLLGFLLREVMLNGRHKPRL